MKKAIYISLASISFILGTIGIFLPILPTTPFYLLTTSLLLHSSPKLHARFVQSSFYQRFIQKIIFEKKITRKEACFGFFYLILLFSIPFFMTRIVWLKILLASIFIVQIISFFIYFRFPKKKINREKVN